MTDQTKKKKKGPRFLRHRAKYENDINGFNVTEKSPIRNGMVMERQCTDMFCGVVLVVCALAFFGVFGYAVSKGKVERIFAGVDQHGKMCGQIGTSNQERPLLKVPIEGYDYGVCVENCTTGYKEFFFRCLPTDAASASEKKISD